MRLARSNVRDVFSSPNAGSIDIAVHMRASTVPVHDPLASTRPDPFSLGVEPASPSTSDLTDDDETLMRRLCAGETAAFAALYDRYASRVFGLTLAILRDGRLAEEVTHDIFLGLWRRPLAYDATEGAFVAWFLRVARNRAIDVVRRRREQPFAVDASHEHPPAVARWSAEPEPDPAELAVSLAVGRDVRAALVRLTPDQRRLLELAYFGGFTQHEIADHLERPLGTVKSQIRAAMRRLAELLDVWNPTRTDELGGGAR